MAAHRSTSVLGNFLEPARTNVWGALVAWMPPPFVKVPVGVTARARGDKEVPLGPPTR